MKYLAYCIFSGNKGTHRSDTPTGIGGRPTYVIENNGLYAVVSAISDSEISKASSTILTYHHVIESFHDKFGAIPLRFGTLVDDEAEIGRVLETHGERYKGLLKELAGRVEMGIRIICNDVPAIRDSHNQTAIPHGPHSPGTGAAYLADRKARLDALQLTDEHNQQIIARYRSFFEGLFVKFRGEARKSAESVTDSNAVVLSLYFLIPRQSVAAFREVYDRLKPREPTKTLLSGPWPPYNFVLPADF